MYHHRRMRRTYLRLHAEHAPTTKKERVFFKSHATALMSNRMILKLAFGTVNIFVPILLYQYFGVAMLGVYILMSIIVVFLTPLSAMLLSRLGVRKMIAISIPFAAASVWVLSYAPLDQGIAGILYAVCMAIYTSLYWVPYHVDLAQHIEEKHRGLVLGWYEDMLEIVALITPLLGGILIAFFGFTDTFILVAMVCLLALIPLKYVGEVYERFSWGYFETFQRLFSARNRRLLIGYASDGAQTSVATIIWPVFIFELLHGEYIVVGLITTVSLVIILILNIFLGFWIDKVGHRRVLALGTIFSVSGWILKSLVSSPFQVFATDTYYKFGDSITRLSKNVAGYGSAAENGHYIDEYTTLAELSHRMGHIFILVLSAIILSFFGVHIVFIMTAIVASGLILFRTHMMVK
jgi:MFS family permease